MWKAPYWIIIKPSYIRNAYCNNNAQIFHLTLLTAPHCQPYLCNSKLPTKLICTEIFINTMVIHLNQTAYIWYTYGVSILKHRTMVNPLDASKWRGFSFSDCLFACLRLVLQRHTASPFWIGLICCKNIGFRLSTSIAIWMGFMLVAILCRCV